MELKEQPFAPTLAHKLGDVPHVSGVLRRIAQLSGAWRRGFPSAQESKASCLNWLIFPNKPIAPAAAWA